MPVSSSTAGYIAEIFVLQFRHLPPRKIQLRTGMLSYGAIAFPHFVQLDEGRTMDLSAGMRRMHTFKKLPMTNPSRNTPRGITPRLCHTRRTATTIAARAGEQTGNSGTATLGCPWATGADVPA